jgi:hypothetical protein
MKRFVSALCADDVIHAVAGGALFLGAFAGETGAFAGETGAIVGALISGIVGALAAMRRTP